MSKWYDFNFHVFIKKILKSSLDYNFSRICHDIEHEMPQQQTSHVHCDNPEEAAYTIHDFSCYSVSVLNEYWSIMIAILISILILF